MFSSRFLVLAASALLILLGLTGIQRGDELVSGSLTSRQLLWLALALPVGFVSWAVPYRQLKGWSTALFLLCLVMLVAVFFFPPHQGARRWIPLGVLDLQPSEITKLAFLLALSEYLMFRRNHRTVWGLIPPFAMTVVPVVLILKEPDLGTALVFFPMLFAILFAAGARPKHLLCAVALGLATLPLLWSVMSAEQRSRVTAVFLQRDDGSPQTGDGYHLHQSKQVLALGGVWGSELSGMPLSDPAAYHLPAARTDFILCLVGERWGLPGTLGVLIANALLIIGGLGIAARTRDPFGRLVATGIVTLLATQCLINTGMTVGLCPITGLTLPFLSYGGSSLLTTTLAVSLLVNIGSRPGYDVAGQPFRFGE